MDLNQLRTFQLLAIQNSFSRTAAALHLSQPAVTLQIKRLEQELGEPLIERLGRSIALTPAGEMLLVYAEQILNLTDQALTNVRQFSGQRGRLTIGSGTTNTIFRLPDILSQFHRHYPQVEIKILNGDSKLICRMVQENAVDLGLVTTIDPTAHLTISPLFTDHIWLIAPQYYPDRLTTLELMSESLVIFRAGSGFRHFLEEQFQRYHFTPKVSMELESMEAILRLVKNGLGLAFLPEVAVQEPLVTGELKQVALENWGSMSRQTFLIYRPDKYLTWPIKAFLAQIRSN
jgi:DNA-binding transcriptional LysR family regulator